MTDIDRTRIAYIMLLGNDGLKDAVTSSLINFGFEKKQLVFESANRFGRVGDYVVDLLPAQDGLSLMVSKITAVKPGPNDNNLVISSQIASIPLTK